MTRRLADAEQEARIELNSRKHSTQLILASAQKANASERAGKTDCAPTTYLGIQKNIRRVRLQSDPTSNRSCGGQQLNRSFGGQRVDPQPLELEPQRTSLPSFIARVASQVRKCQERPEHSSHSSGSRRQYKSMCIHRNKNHNRSFWMGQPTASMHRNGACVHHCRQ